MQDIWFGLEVIVYWSRCIGLWCFERKAPMQYIRNYYTQITKTIILVLVYSTFFKAAYDTGLYSITNAREQSGIIHFFAMFYYMGFGITTILYYVVKESFGTKLMHLVKAIEEIDSSFREDRLRQCNKYLLRFSLISLSIQILVLIMDFIVANILITTATNFEIVVYTVSYVVHNTMSIQFLVLVIALQQRFEILQEGVEETIRESLEQDVYPINEEIFMHAVDNVAEQHEKLVDISKDVNLIYAIPLTSNITLIFVILIYNGYKIIYNISLTKIIDFNMLCTTCTYLFVNCAELFAIVYLSSVLCKQVSAYYLVKQL